MFNYGKTTKQICFDSNDHLHANLKLRLHYDDLKIKEFFNEIIKAYVDKNEYFMNFIDELKEQKQVSKIKRNKTNKAFIKAKKVEKEFGLDKSEIENIFDIIEKEWGV
jgi:hypothetical protein